MFWIRNWKVHFVVVLIISTIISLSIGISEFESINKKDNDKIIQFASIKKSNAQLIYQELQKYLTILLQKVKTLSIKNSKTLELTKYQKAFSKLNNQEKTALETWTIDKLQNHFKIKCVQNFQKWKLKTKNSNIKKYPDEFKNWKTFHCNRIKNDLK